ncbi:MAG: isopenicillin N synthase family oxygenase [Alphaproteobacteria bacterium]|nr:isopenicillin N synthase family oxygenase [Alphaproteobacteria bacterium]
MDDLPVIDLTPFFGEGPSAARAEAARKVAAACREIGFFYVTAHRIPENLISRLERTAGEFFALPESEKLEIAMARGGRAWRGYFPIGGELTSGKPDLKEGIYFGTELGGTDARVRAGIPMHGANLFPRQVTEVKQVVLAYLDAASRAAHAVMEAIALSLDLDADYFRRIYTADPTVLFRMFHYPDATEQPDIWSVGEHTDYGLLTLLLQDDVGGLEVKGRSGWIAAPPRQGTLVCNIGDMLDRLTRGAYRSTGHRVRNTSGRDRFSFPFFFDPAFDARIVPLPGFEEPRADDVASRWDHVSVHDFSGSYGDYLLAKVSKVFPELNQAVIAKAAPVAGSAEPA